MKTENAMPLSDVLYAFAVAKAVPDIETLDEFAKRYPQYASELTEFAIELLLDSAATADLGPDSIEQEDEVSPAVARAISHFHNVVYELDTASKSKNTTLVRNPIAELDKAAFKEFAATMHANNVFAMKLRDRVIDPDTIFSRPGFCQMAADALNMPLLAMVEHFRASPTLSGSAYYKAENKPTVTRRETFEEAVQSSGLTPEQQQYLLSL